MKRISETHSELCETCVMEGFCEDHEQLKEFIYIELYHRCLAGFHTSGINFKKFSTQFTLHQGLKRC